MTRLEFTKVKTLLEECWDCDLHRTLDLLIRSKSAKKSGGGGRAVGLPNTLSQRFINFYENWEMTLSLTRMAMGNLRGPVATLVRDGWDDKDWGEAISPQLPRRGRSQTPRRVISPETRSLLPITSMNILFRSLSLNNSFTAKCTQLFCFFENDCWIRIWIVENSYSQCHLGKCQIVK